jgi:leader peptidase (prepilin peptidase) / N-methyltransferase
MDAFWIVFLFLIAACVGSFLNVVIHRVPRRESIAFPGSHCPICGKGIAWYDNIPLLSWLLLRGRCRHCKTRISPRYIVIEGLTALMVVGLYVAYFIVRVRPEAGSFEENWPMFVAHATLLCALLACSVVDIDIWEVLPEACWFASAVGLAAATLNPMLEGPVPFLMPVSPEVGAASVGAALGLIVGNVLLWTGHIQPSFLDATDTPSPGSEDPQKKEGGEPKAIAYSREHGVNPRVEMLREMLFLAPAFVGAMVAWGLVEHFPAAGDAWQSAVASEAWYAPHLAGLTASLAGYLVGGAWIWGIRILGTLGFGKEAMGLGDVHILAAVGAVCGWLVPTIAFFVAPFFGLLWALYLLLTRNQRELPYGPWLAAAAVVVMLAMEPIMKLLAVYTALL